jgi:hypothetical protein
MLVPGVIVLAIGLVAAAVGVWFNWATADDGTGANIGAGALILLGVVVSVAGGLILTAAGVERLFSRQPR